MGRSVAWHLCRLAFDVLLVDARPEPSATTRASLGVLTHYNGGDSPLSHLYRQAHQGYAALSQELAEQTGIDIGWRAPGGLDLILTDEDDAAAEEELRLNHARGCPVERLGADAVLALEPRVSPRVRGGLWFPGDHRVDPERLCAALRRGIAVQGGEVRFGEALLGLDPPPAGEVVARTTQRVQAFDFAVLAAGAWTAQLAETVGACVPVRPIRGQHLRFAGERVAHVVRHGGHHAVPAAGATLVGATVEEVGFDLAATPEAAQTLGEALRRMEGRDEGEATVPAPLPAEQRAGLRPKPKGGRPLIGPLGAWPRVFVATGHYKSGVLMGPVTGRIVAEWMAHGQPPRDMRYFAPER